MIHIVLREDFRNTVQGFLRHSTRGFDCVRILSYERLFARGRTPVGHYIFTDFDRLDPAAIEVLARLSDDLRARAPQVRILNDPRKVLERVPLLARLRREDLNRFDVTRLDAGERPDAFPVFVRSEDGCGGPETGLLRNLSELEAALEELHLEGRGLKRRIAVGFCAQRDDRGLYRKYGAMNIDGHIIPQHMHCSEHWDVKWANNFHDAGTAREEIEYIRTNPHRDALARIFRIAGIDYGRIDYGLVDGTVQTYEINTNPRLPRYGLNGNERTEQRRILIRPAMEEALRAIDKPLPSGPDVPLHSPEYTSVNSDLHRHPALHRMLRRLYHAMR
ncbi:ATP-grasp domain-containing protein [Thioalkalivibrio thiocyanodenitrificans]|uniref:hypothetical protein n=1 Tax=Thioalkalivibrio thiocyanodenitrificans TaxID=243063 RepID=UPI00035CEFE5|nr:hypothetical protein [Thioalkalivibrio thiocyanodenitrificans]